jgi:TPR repeat protein/uncharacterized membrane protein
MNKCTHCQAENEDSLSFCTHCGKKLPPSLAAFLKEHSLEDHYPSFIECGVSSVSDLSYANLESFRTFLPYGHIIRLRTALQKISSAPLAEEASAQSREVEEMPATQSPPDAPTVQYTAPSQAPLQDPAAIVPEAKDRLSRTRRNYTIMLWSVPTLGLAGLVGALLANNQLKKTGAADQLTSGHLRWQTRTFALSLIWGIVLSICGALVFQEDKNQNFLPIFAWGWFYYRVLKGRSLLKKEQPVYKTDPGWSNLAIGIACVAAILVAAVIGASGDSKPSATNVGSATSGTTEAVSEDDSRLADIERQREEAERRARQAEEEAHRLRQTAEQAQREKEEALQRAREFEQAAQVSVAEDASYGSKVLEFSDAKSRADSGDAYAQAVVSIYYATGYKAPKDIALAAEYAIKSAEQGHPLGIYRLGAMRQSGDGMVPDEQQGLLLKNRAFAGLDRMVGDPYAMTALGIMLFRGENVAKDKAAAARLYRQAADMGYAPAQFTYSACLLSGQGVPKNESLGLQYWQQSYAQNYPPALEGPPR